MLRVRLDLTLIHSGKSDLKKCSLHYLTRQEIEIIIKSMIMIILTRK
jgi:hypothetical protein